MSSQVLFLDLGGPDQCSSLFRALNVEPVVVRSAQEALRAMGERSFGLVAVATESKDHFETARRVIRKEHPEAMVVSLDGSTSDRQTIVSAMRENPFPSDRELIRTFSGSLDVDETLQRIVRQTLSLFEADRCWLLCPVDLARDSAISTKEATAPGVLPAFIGGEKVPLKPFRPIIERVLSSEHPISVSQHDSGAAFGSSVEGGTNLIQALTVWNGEKWLFGLQQSRRGRTWSGQEIERFASIGAIAVMAINSALLFKKADAEAAKVQAILDLIPEPAAIFREDGTVDRMNLAAQKDSTQLLQVGGAGSSLTAPHYPDGTLVSSTEMPSVRALLGETVSNEFVVPDARNAADLVISVKASPVRDKSGGILGSVVLSRDITEERVNEERDMRRRKRADCLANLALDLVADELRAEDLSGPARRVGQCIGGNVEVYFYRSSFDRLELVGSSFISPAGDFIRSCLLENPYRPGEGLPGTAFQIGRPLFFSDVRGSAITDYARDPIERQAMAALNEQSLIACPIESYGERVGALLLSLSDQRRNFDAEDLEFAQSVADRLGAAIHIHRLNRIAQEGHRAAEELARREVDARARFEAVLDSAPVGIAVISADELRFELANPEWLAFAAKVGRVDPDTKVVGLRVSEVLPGFEDLLKEVAERGEIREEEAVSIRRGKSTFYIKRIISPVRGRFSGTTQSLTVLVQDVTDQVRAKREIEALAQLMEERSARQDSIIASMTDALWVYDASGRVVDVNPAAVSLFGLGSRSEAIDHGSLDEFLLRYPDGRAVPIEEMPYARALRGEIVPDYLAVGRHLIAGKDIDLSIATAPIQSGGSIVGAVLVMRDITGLQELDRKKDEFLSVASHELRTPLTTIKGYAQLLAQTVNDITREDRVTYLSAVLGEIDRMMGLISELLDVSRIETNRLQLHPQAVNWLQFLDRQASAFRVQHPGRKINFLPKIDDVTLQVDPDRIRQAVDNLLSNALKYSPDGSDIDVVVEERNGSIKTSFIDHGIGIPNDELPQLFERFHRARNVSSRYYGGLGLGLYIAKAIIQAHGGTISIQSEEGQGSTFTVSLPSASILPSA